MRTPIVLLSGAAGSGKDTVAALLRKHAGAATLAMADPMKEICRDLFGFTHEQLWGPSARRSEAVPVPLDLVFRTRTVGVRWLEGLGLPITHPNAPHLASVPLQRLHRWAFALEVAGGPVTARHALQTLGTEWGRAIDPDLWIGLALRKSRELLLAGAPLAVITDGRFRNEVLATKAAGGAAVRIRCPGAGLAGAAALHTSETEQDQIPDFWFDHVLRNDKSAGLEALEFAVAVKLRSALLLESRLYV